MAAKHQGYNWADYEQLLGSDQWITEQTAQDSKSAVIARYRVLTMMDNIRNDVSIQEAKRK